MRHFVALTVALLFWSSSATAGQLVLRNGATIPGELVGFEKEHLIWNAELIGELKVIREDVKTMDTATHLNLFVTGRGRVNDCVVNKNTDDGSNINCAGEEPFKVSMATLSVPAPDWESTGSVLADINFQRYNTDKDEYDVDGKMSWRKFSRRNNLVFEVDRELRDNVVVEDQLLLTYQMDFLRELGWYRYLRVSYEADDFSAARQTAFLGGGIGRERNLGNGITLRLQTGLDYAWGEIRQDECVITAVDGSCLENSTVLKENSSLASNTQWKLNWPVAWHDLVLFHDGELKLGTNGDLRYRVDTNSGLRIPLRFGIISEIGLEYDVVSKPLDSEADRQNIEWKLRFGYQW